MAHISVSLNLFIENIHKNPIKISNELGVSLTQKSRIEDLWNAFHVQTMFSWILLNSKAIDLNRQNSQVKKFHNPHSIPKDEQTIFKSKLFLRKATPNTLPHLSKQFCHNSKSYPNNIYIVLCENGKIV